MELSIHGNPTTMRMASGPAHPGHPVAGADLRTRPIEGKVFESIERAEGFQAQRGALFITQAW